ncbi:MAG TPA: ATP-binding protein [Polyangiaceae bacterium]
MPHAVPPRPRPGRLYVAAASALLAAIALLSAGIGSYVSAKDWVDHTIEVRRQVYEWLSTLLDSEAGARGYVASGDPAFVPPYESAVTRERANAAALQALVADNEAETGRVRAAAAEAQAVMGDLRGLVTLVSSGHRDEAVSRLTAGQSKSTMDSFRAATDGILDQEARLLVERRETAATRAWVTLAGAASLALAAFGLLLVGWRRERAHDAMATALAKEARARIRALSELGAALSDARTRKQVAEVVVDHGARTAGADICTLYALSENGETLELLGQRGCPPEVLERIREIDRASGSPSFTTLKSGESLWGESAADYATMYPSLAKMDATGPRAQAFWSVPLVAEGRPIGLLGAGYHQPRRFSADERAFVDTLADQCAQALLRASRFEREDEGQRWLTTTLRSIGDAVIATDVQGRVTFMNPIAEYLTGWAETDARTRPLDEVFSIFSELTRKHVESPVTKVLREGRVVGLANHTVLRAKGGVEVPIDDSGAPIRGDDNRLLGVVLVFRDATREKRERMRADFLARAGEALVSSLDYESTLANVASLCVPMLADWCAIDLATGAGGASRQVAVAHVDPAKVRLAREFGQRYPPDVNAPRGVPQVIRTGKAELYPEIPAEILESAARDAEHLRLIRDLKLRSGMVVPIRGRDRVLGAITFIHAESERRYGDDDLHFAEDFARRAAMAIENAIALAESEAAHARERILRDEADAANRAKDEFLGMVSHELRTPLNAILGWTVMVRRRQLGEEVDRALAIIERNARAQTRLINDVLDMSRIISGKMVLNPAPTRVAEVVAAAVETVAPAAQAKDIRITADVPDHELTVVADADRLQQVVWNLLSNAIKFTPREGHVSVGARGQGEDVVIRVHDSGEGIRPDVLPLVFEPFQQADTSTTRRHGGLGLGLAIVKRIVAAHGGAVHAASEGAGKGATFTVTLPARALALRASPVPARPPGSPTAPEASAEGQVRLDGLRLLVVDDEEDARAMVSGALRDLGAEVYLAGSAHEALERFADVRPDVLVSDIGMPEADGYFLIRQIRSKPRDEGGRTPAVALTAYARAEDEQRAFAAGFQKHVTKPVEPLHLATVVANLGGKSLDGGGGG